MPTEFSGTREQKYAATATGVSYVPGWVRRTCVGGLNKNARIAFAERFGRIRREQDLPWNANSLASPKQPRRENLDFQPAIVCEKGVAAGLRPHQAVSVTVRIQTVCGKFAAGMRQDANVCVAKGWRSAKPKPPPPENAASAGRASRRYRACRRNRFCRQHRQPCRVRCHATQEISAQFVTVLAVTNRHAQRTAARQDIAVRNVMLRCGACGIVNASCCGGVALSVR